MTKNIANIGRRKVLLWSSPVITALTLPTHAQMTEDPPPTTEPPTTPPPTTPPPTTPPPPCECEGPPVLSVTSIPKCSGDPPVGTATIEITAPGECGMEIKSLEYTTTDDKSTLDNLPSFPISVTQSSGASFTWTGPASDATTCLPLAQINVTIEYCCEDEVVLEETYDLTDLLVSSVP